MSKIYLFLLFMISTGSALQAQVASVAVTAREENTSSQPNRQDADVMPGSQNVMSRMSAITVTGTVLEANQQSMPGVNVIEKGTSNGTVTDADGKFSLTVTSENSVLVFSFIGY